MRGNGRFLRLDESKIEFGRCGNFRSRAREFGISETREFREASKVTALLRIERRARKLAGTLFSLCARTRMLASLLEGIIAVLLSGERNFEKVAPKPTKLLSR